MRARKSRPQACSPSIVPAETMPVFSELQKRGWVVIRRQLQVARRRKQQLKLSAPTPRGIFFDTKD